MKSLFSLLMVGLLMSKVYGQSYFYEKGYIVQQQDTLYGFIEKTDELKLSQSVSFKEHLETATAATFSPSELNGFGFSGSRLTFSPVEVDIILPGITRKANRFAKRLVSGDINLYKLYLLKGEKKEILRKGSPHVYIVEKEGAYTTLGEYEVQFGNRVRLDKKYLGKLRVLLNDCLNSNSDIPDNMKFTDDALIELIIRYNRCKSPEAESIIHAYKVKAEVKHGLQGIYARIVTIDNSISRDQGYSLGYYWDITRPQFSRKISNIIGVNYLNLRYVYTYYSGASWRPKKMEVPIKLHYIRIPFHAQYNFNNHAAAVVSPFVVGGLTAQLSTDNTFSYLDIIPFLSVGGGVHIKRLKVSVTIDNLGFSIKDDKILNLSLGLRLDHNKAAGTQP
jgi:hypothetical protein